MGSKSCWTPVLSQRESDKYNFLSIKVTEREAWDLRVLFIQRTVLNLFPFGEKKNLNWVDTHYWRRMGEQRVECGGSEIRDTQRANSLVLVGTAIPRWHSLLPPKTIGHNRGGNRQIPILWNCGGSVPVWCMRYWDKMSDLHCCEKVRGFNSHQITQYMTSNQKQVLYNLSWLTMS